MKIYFAHNNEIDYKKGLYGLIKDSNLSKKHEFIFPHEGGAYKNSKEIIRECALVIAEVSYPSTGLGIELGWANMLNVPIICIYRKGSKPSNSVYEVTSKVVEYSSESLVNKLSDVI